MTTSYLAQCGEVHLHYFTARGSSSPIQAGMCLAVIGNSQDSIENVTLVYGDLLLNIFDGFYSTSERRTRVVSQLCRSRLSVNKVQFYTKTISH